MQKTRDVAVISKLFQRTGSPQTALKLSLIPPKSGLCRSPIIISYLFVALPNPIWEFLPQSNLWINFRAFAQLSHTFVRSNHSAINSSGAENTPRRIGAKL